MEPNDPVDPYRAPRTSDELPAAPRAPGAALPWNAVDAYTFAWEALRKHPAAILLYLVAIVISGVIGGIAAGIQAALDATGDSDLIVVGWIVYGAGILLGIPLGVWMSLGQARVSLLLARGTRPSFSVLFDGRHYLAALGATLLLMLVHVAAFAVILGPGFGLLAADADAAAAVVLVLGALAYAAVAIVLSARWLLWTCALADGAGGSFDSLRRSWDLTRGIFWHVVLFGILTFAISIAAGVIGVLACCVGILVTVPAAQGLMQIAIAHAYLKRSGVEPVGPK
jgi:hypothetical protein